jgi:hypothetical protein
MLITNPVSFQQNLWFKLHICCINAVDVDVVCVKMGDRMMEMRVVSSERLVMRIGLVRF